MDKQVADKLVEAVAVVVVGVEVALARGFLRGVGLLLIKRSDGRDRGHKIRKTSGSMETHPMQPRFARYSDQP